VGGGPFGISAFDAVMEIHFIAADILGEPRRDIAFDGFEHDILSLEACAV